MFSDISLHHSCFTFTVAESNIEEAAHINMWFNCMLDKLYLKTKLEVSMEEMKYSFHTDFQFCLYI